MERAVFSGHMAQRSSPDWTMVTRNELQRILIMFDKLWAGGLIKQFNTGRDDPKNTRGEVRF